MDVKLIQGNSLDTLKTLPDKSVQTCITSPPYYGLRDYGTALWQGGGDDSCNHAEKELRTGLGLAALGEKYRGGGHKQGDLGYLQYKGVCLKCGAVRVDEQVGLEETPKAYVQKLVDVFSEVHRVLKDDGTVWLNLGDSYAGSSKGGQSASKKSDNWQPEYALKGNLGGFKPKDLMGIPWRVAFALQDEGWYLRQDIIWEKPNPMPESVTDRCTKAHEYIFLLSKSERYYFDHEAIKEKAAQNRWGGNKPFSVKNSKDNENTFKGLTRERNMMPETRNKRSVWSVATKPYREAHFATFPEELIRPCVLAGSAKGDTILDPFNGAGTTGLVALQHGRKYIGLELNPEYVKLTEKRLEPLLAQPALAF